MKNCRLLIFSMVLWMPACAQKESAPVLVERDTSITPDNAFTNLFLDSVLLADYIEKENLQDSVGLLLQNFYNSRNFQLAWFTEDGVAEQTQGFFTLHQQYIDEFKDSSLMFPTAVRAEMERILFRDTLIDSPSIPLAEIELRLTHHFFNYVSSAYSGKVDPAVLQWHIPRKKVDALALLDSLVERQGRSLEEWEPLNRQYRRLKKAMLHLYEVERSSDWNDIMIEGGGVFREGDSTGTIAKVKRKLFLTGDFPLVDTSGIFSPALTAAVKRYQSRMGIKQDGVIGKEVIGNLNVPIKKRIEQLLINMERMRWMPDLPEGNGIVVNIPQFQLHVFEAGEVVLKMDIVVGKTGSQTVIFSDMLKYVVFSPYWNVPPSIVRAEIYPAMQKDDNYLAKKNMEQTGFSHGLPIIRQKPGSTNSLGRVKFIFPNNYNIYFHDTPARSLFGEEKRAFSHGCIRLEKPEALAIYLLRDRPEWDPVRIARAMRSDKEKWVPLESPMPVFISYFTAWVDGNGLLHFRDDLYGHDQKMGERLFHTIK